MCAAAHARNRRENEQHRHRWLIAPAADPEYEPLTHGMRAAVPRTDEPLAGNSIAFLEPLAAVLEET